MYDEAVRRFAPYVGTSYQKGVVALGQAGRGLRDLRRAVAAPRFMVPGGVMCAPNLSDVTRAIAILEHWKDNWLEGEWLGCSVERWLEIKTWEDMLAWVDENEAQHNSDCGFFIRYCLDVGLDKYGAGCRQLLRDRHLLRARPVREPDHRRPQRRADRAARASTPTASGTSSTTCASREDVTHSFYAGHRPLHPWEGETDPGRPGGGREQGKYCWAKSPRYDVPGMGRIPLEAGPLARRMAAAGPNALPGTRTTTRCSPT